ncbi:MAG: bifunctional pyr operon transcriptional regulator/uracil phosphoribosyltransferase PyrR [Deltaproteobacteria bacterium CG_4_10_14_0_2_um_filter_43_8]|nr:MAG: bifunctional pyr operon transcriptional regulator/uracil phosphoribosyltransferase [Deltaproteobacteria bacterium CG11_big_fil_rev_8_21_14_0_20_42_23]PJA22312.1 MAG: bifunctional pyr operon transcriptional regulator/uracil phosphoribosyltransferase PyrR [Deltaproteobacteria bacterium CG_4_10_14_0_2_um_filter_43_8]PJC64374.1 MAG: bifunctional pyr operon transcriptional regulator/uracil phosphoribosyltransferase PyrR [Deltaproteobacteria bacterium CG_4_9_14_0_2_um_filter_42_21]
MTARLLMSESQMDQAIDMIARKIVEDGTDNVSLVGIRTRGVPLATWLAKKIEAVQGKPIEVGMLDINLYRDDLSEVGEQPCVKKTELPFSINGRGIILVDDVLYTGRTVCSALDALLDYGRPRFVKLMVMVDRGWRELPIQAEYVAKKIETTSNENVKVMFQETDNINQVSIKTT